MRDSNLKLKIELVNPPQNYAFCLQKGKGSNAERLEYTEILEKNLTNVNFQLEIVVRKAKHGDQPDFFGPFVQGSPGNRFFYLCVGEVVQSSDPNWSGRVKVPLSGIDWTDVRAVEQAGSALIAQYEASMPNGKPVYASVNLLGDGWKLENG